MAFEISLRTIVPLTLLIGLGVFAKRKGILKQDEERVLSSFVFYFALPAFFLVNIAETKVTVELINYVVALSIPVTLFGVTVVGVGIVLKSDMRKVLSVIVCSSFGSVAFFGVPFILFAFPTGEAQQLAAISASVLGIVGLTMTILALELKSVEKLALGKVIKKLMLQFAKNPLILSLVVGLAISFSGYPIWQPVRIALGMMGRSAAPVALVMLGAFLCGRNYRRLTSGLLLSQVRILILPTIALIAARLFGLSPMEEKIAVLMNAMPLAVAVAVFSQKYHFEEERVASVLLVSSLSAVIHLNLWLFILE